MIRPTPVHRPVWEPVYRDVQGPVWLNGAGGEPYPGHNPVVFANDDRLTNTALGITSPTGFFFAAKFRLPSLPAGNWFLWNSGRGSGASAAAYTHMYVSAAGEVEVAAANPSAGAPRVEGATSGAGLTSGVDYTVHASINPVGRDDVIESVAPANGVYTAELLAQYYPGLTVFRNSVPQVEGVDFTITQTSPLILTFGAVFNGADTVDIYIPGDRLKVWINGVSQLITNGTNSGGTTWTMTSAAANRAVIGSRHDVIATPTYSTTEYLGYVDGISDVGITVSFFIFDDAPNEDPSTTSNNGADIDLSAFTAAGATPAHVFFGGTQEAADWNAGTNQGSGPDFTMSGDVTS